MQKIDLDGLGPLPQRGKTLQLAMYARNAPKYPTLRVLREKLGFTNGNSVNKAIQFRTLISNSLLTGFIRLTDSEEGAHIGNETSLDTCVRPATLREHAASSAVRYRGPTVSTLKQLDMSAEEWVEVFGFPDGPPKTIHVKELAALKRRKDESVEGSVIWEDRERAAAPAGSQLGVLSGPCSFYSPQITDGRIEMRNPTREAHRPAAEGPAKEPHQPSDFAYMLIASLGFGVGLLTGVVIAAAYLY